MSLTEFTATKDTLLIKSYKKTLNNALAADFILNRTAEEGQKDRPESMTLILALPPY